MAGNHPVFAPLYNGLAWAGEKTTLGRWRTEALAPANGRLLIVGLGPGYDLAHIPPAVTEIVAVEPAALVVGHDQHALVPVRRVPDRRRQARNELERNHSSDNGLICERPSGIVRINTGT